MPAANGTNGTNGTESVATINSLKIGRLHGKNAIITGAAG